MGERAVVYFKDYNRGFSCGIYLHWDGSPADVHRHLEAAAPRMRHNDSMYSAARFCGHMHTVIEGNLSLGLLPPVTWEDIRDDTSDDNGIFVVDTDTWEVNQYLDGKLVGVSYRLENKPPQ